MQIDIVGQMSGCDQCLFTRKVETTCAFVALVRNIFRSRLQRQTSKALQPLNTLTHMHKDIYEKKHTSLATLCSWQKTLTLSYWLTDQHMDGWLWLMA